MILRKAARKFSTTLCHYKSGKGTSSNQWLLRQQNDPYIEKAKMFNYRCRSAFKLLEIDERMNFFKPGQTVLDCGASPGSWTQVAVKKVNSDGSNPKSPQGRVISVDKQQIYPINGAVILGNYDFMQAETQEKISSYLDGHQLDIVLSDMAPNATGVKSLDTENIIELCYAVLRLAVTMSTVNNSVLIMKLWQCGMSKQLENDVSRFYKYVKFIKPNASRSDSAEIFIFAKDFKGLKKS